MIYCNLAGLMANKKTNITEVSKDTHISRTTLTSLYYNKYKGIQIDTADTLCKYFNVGMDKLFLFSKYDISAYIGSFKPSIVVGETDCADSIVTFEVTFGSTKKVCDVHAQCYYNWHEKEVSCQVIFEYFIDDEDEKLKADNIFLKRVFNSLSDEFKGYIIDSLTDNVTYEIASAVEFQEKPKRKEEIKVNYEYSNNLW